MEEEAKMEDDALTDDEKKLILGSAGVITSEGSQGFFSADWYDTTKELESDWKDIEDEYEKFYEESGEPE